MLAGMLACEQERWVGWGTKLIQYRKVPGHRPKLEAIPSFANFGGIAEGVGEWADGNGLGKIPGRRRDENAFS